MGCSRQWRHSKAWDLPLRRPPDSHRLQPSGGGGHERGPFALSGNHRNGQNGSK